MAISRSRGARERSARRRGDQGSQMMEFVGVFPVVLLIILIVFETFAAFTALERMESAARAGARLASTHGTAGAAQAATDTLPGWLQDRGASVTVGVTGDGYYGEVTAQMPLVFQSTGLEFPLSRRVDMPRT